MSSSLGDRPKTVDFLLRGFGWGICNSISCAFILFILYISCVWKFYRFLFTIKITHEKVSNVFLLIHFITVTIFFTPYCYHTSKTVVGRLQLINFIEGEILSHNQLYKRICNKKLLWLSLKWKYLRMLDLFHETLI